MGALRTWLGLEGWTRFAHEHYGKQPFVMPCVAPEVLRACSWDSLDRALASRAADVQVVRRGESLSIAPPRSLAALRALFEHDTGIALRNADRASARVRALAAAIGEDVPGNRRAAMFATPAGTHSLAWHFDLDDLFIVQVAGTKTHHLRSNTVLPRPLTQTGHSLAAYALETSPLLTFELRAGDFLYVPAGFWHMAMAKADQDSLSIAVGVLGSRDLPQKPTPPALRARLRERVLQVRERLALARTKLGDTLDRAPTLRRNRPI
jgi:ribosomal protein L16 Arg81 hydroxylase